MSKTHIGLLRGINVGGHNKLPMAQLRSFCDDIGWTNARTYIQSGNVVFDAVGPTHKLENMLERCVESSLGRAIPVVVRSARDWRAYLAHDPFPAASAQEPNRVMLALSKASPAPDAVKQLLERATRGERIALTGSVLWFHFPEGIAGSRLTSALIDRTVGSTVTLRNWRTVQKLGDMAGLRADG